MAIQYEVLTAIGTDRVGIVDDLSALIEESSCNIEESRMAVLGGEFAVIMLITGEEGQIDLLRESIKDIENKLDLSIVSKKTEAPHMAPAGRPYLIESFSLDAPGIVHSVSALLHKYNINIEDLETDTSSAPWTGAAMFHMRAHIIVPSSISVPELREQLEKLEHDRDLDITMKPVPIHWTEQ